MTNQIFLYEIDSVDLRKNQSKKLPEQYSNFKFGSVAQTRKYAKKLACKILEIIKDYKKGEKVSLVTCGFKFIGSPNAFLIKIQ